MTTLTCAPPELHNCALLLEHDDAPLPNAGRDATVQVAIFGDATLRWVGVTGAGARDGDGPADAVLLPLDALFETRALSALRLWRALRRLAPGPDPAALSAHRRRRLVRALRALDARRAGASYREIAAVMFGEGRVGEAAWKTHPLRSQTIRLARLGADLMRGGYRELLLHPYRRRDR